MHLGLAGAGAKGVWFGARPLLAQIDHALHLVVRAEAPPTLRREVERRSLRMHIGFLKVIPDDYFERIPHRCFEKVPSRLQLLRRRSQHIEGVVLIGVPVKLSVSHWPAPSMPCVNKQPSSPEDIRNGNHSGNTSDAMRGLLRVEWATGEVRTLWQPSDSQRRLATSTMPLLLCWPQYCAGWPAQPQTEDFKGFKLMVWGLHIGFGSRLKT